MFKNLLRRVTGRKEISAAVIQNLLAGVSLSELIDYESYMRAGCRKVWASWKACDITANSLSNTPFAIVRAGNSKPVTVTGLADLFESPNDTMTIREMVYLAAMHIKMTGNAFWFKAETVLASGGKRPKQLFPLNPKRVRIMPQPNTGKINGYVYTSAFGQAITLDPEDVIHFKRPHPNNDFWGLGDIEAGEDLFNEHVNRNKWQKQFWKNGASPSTLLINDDDQQPDEEAWKIAKEKFQREYGGGENAGKTAWLSGKWRKEQLGLSLSEMQNIEASKWNVEQIFLQHGVPLSVAGIRDAANFATADIDNQRFKEFTVLPIVLMLQDAITSDLVAGYGPQLKLKFNVSGLINMGKALLDLAPAFDRGVLSINEIRETLHLEPDPSNPLWNQHYITAALVPLELSGVADLQNVDQQAQQTVQRFINTAMATKRNDENRPEAGDEGAAEPTFTITK